MAVCVQKRLLTMALLTVVGVIYGARLTHTIVSYLV